MVNKPRVQLLVDALRSGNYTQGKCTLEVKENDIVKNCCLGVACRVAIDNGLKVTVEPLGDTMMFDWERGKLPVSLQLWYGLEADPRIAVVDNCAVYATIANDILGWNFPQIADAFEKMYLSGQDHTE